MPLEDMGSCQEYGSDTTRRNEQKDREVIHNSGMYREIMKEQSRASRNVGNRPACDVSAAIFSPPLDIIIASNEYRLSRRSWIDVSVGGR